MSDEPTSAGAEREAGWVAYGALLPGEFICWQCRSNRAVTLRFELIYGSGGWLVLDAYCAECQGAREPYDGPKRVVLPVDAGLLDAERLAHARVRAALAEIDRNLFIVGIHSDPVTIFETVEETRAMIRAALAAGSGEAGDA